MKADRFVAGTGWLAASALISCLVVAGHERFLAAPRVRLAVVDLAEIFRIQERAMLRQIGQADAGGQGLPGGHALAGAHADRTAAQMLGELRRRLPLALRDLAKDCGCTVLERTAVALPDERLPDLTGALARRLEASP